MSCIYGMPRATSCGGRIFDKGRITTKFTQFPPVSHLLQFRVVLRTAFPPLKTAAMLTVVGPPQSGNDLRPYKELTNDVLTERIQAVRAAMGKRLLILGHH